MTGTSARSASLQTRYVAGLTHLKAGQAFDAINAFRIVLRQDPAHDGARRNLIRASIATGAFDAVIAETAEIPQGIPDCAERHYHRGCALSALGRLDDAQTSLSNAVALDPGHAAGWLNLGNIFMDRDDLAQAEAHCRHALHLDPGLIEARISLGFILTCQGQLAGAIAMLDDAIGRQPMNVQAHWNLATAALLTGDLPRGFAEYEWRKRHDRFRHDFIDPPGPVWDGGDARGKTILVHAEQGFGDTIQFARYLPLIASLGGAPVLACEPPLISFLETIAGARIVSKSKPLPRYDAWIDQMSLPRVFGTTLETIPHPAGYLTAPPGIVPRMPKHIGVAWKGNPLHDNDARRTPPEAVFAPLLASPGYRFVSLVPDRVPPGFFPPPIALTDYAATASVIAALDLVITVDTSVAHAAGAQGRPAWVLLPFAPDWRWLLNRDDTPWYTSLRLFRQPAPGDWPAVIDSVIAALAG